VTTVSVVVATFGRDGVLVQTLDELLRQDPPADEILVVDQTPQHEADVQRYLELGDREGRFRWIVQSPPSLCAARNRGALEARSDVLLYVDDDVLLPTDFVEQHRRCFADPEVSAVAGKVFVPSSNTPCVKENPAMNAIVWDNGEEPWASTVLGSNFSVLRGRYIEVGGFDEQLVGAVYFDETDFSHRLMALGYRIRYCGAAWQIHLKAPAGGCRIAGNRVFPEWTKSVNFWTYVFRSPKSPHMWTAVRLGLRAGPLRRENVMHPLRWPGACGHFLYAVAQGAIRGRSAVVSPFVSKVRTCGGDNGGS
jgi:GT2 family glycosyltransferase